VQDETAPALTYPTGDANICLWPPNYNYFCWYHTNEDSAAAGFNNGVTDNCDYRSGGGERAAIAARIGASQSLIKTLFYASSNDNDIDGEICLSVPTTAIVRPSPM
jgi:hypothetical protein